MSEPSTSTSTTPADSEASPSLVVYVTAIRWRAEEPSMDAVYSAAVAVIHGTVVAQCKACPPKPAVAKNNMLGTAVTGLLPRESWMLVIKFDTEGDADSWATSYSQYFDLIHCVPAA